MVRILTPMTSSKFRERIQVRATKELYEQVHSDLRTHARRMVNSELANHGSNHTPPDVVHP